MAQEQEDTFLKYFNMCNRKYVKCMMEEDIYIKAPTFSKTDCLTEFDKCYEFYNPQKTEYKS